MQTALAAKRRKMRKKTKPFMATKNTTERQRQPAKLHPANERTKAPMGARETLAWVGKFCVLCG
jgi:hypothetical protein